jgi:hypothetical protein
MNIIEVMRKVEETQGFALRKSDKSVSLKSSGGNLLHSRDILADDWEVVE